MGITDEYGRFQYNNGDTVKFSLGDLVLGESQPSLNGLITPKLLIVGDSSTPDSEQDAQITLLLQTLQSLDSDDNNSNGITIGITISSSVIDDLSTLNSEVYFNDINESYLIDLDNQHDLGLDENYDGQLDVNSYTAQTHFAESTNSWDNGNRPDDTTKTTTTDCNSSTGTNTFDLALYPVTPNLTQELEDSLAHMGNEERLAYKYSY